MKARVLVSAVLLFALVGPVGLRGALAQTKGIWMDPAELASRPTSGAAWNNLLAAANKTCATPNLANQDDPANVCVLAKALVFARTGQQSYRLSVVTALWSVVNAGAYSGAALALGRELAAYVIAADLIDLRSYDAGLDNFFRSTISGLLTTPTTGGPGSLIECHEQRPNNWGTHCGASRAAVAAYLSNTTQLARVATVFKGWLGDRASYAGFTYGDLAWQCNSSQPVGINPPGCTKSGHSIDGVLPDDQRRAGGFVWPPPKENYVYEALQGALAQAVILRRAGYDVFNWQNRALLRAFQWLYGQANFPAVGDDTWEPYLINYFYNGVTSPFPVTSPSSPGKNVGWTDWTHSGAPSQPVLTVNPMTLSFAATAGGPNPPAQGVQVSNSGTGAMSWTAAVSDSRWSASPTSGSGNATVNISANTAGLAAGTYSGTVTVAAGGAQGSPAGVSVSVVVSSASQAVSAVSVNPNQVTGGAGSVGRVTISATATGSGTPVALTSSSSIAQVPPIVTVPQGATFADFSVITTGVSVQQQATITATLNGSRQAVLTVTPGTVSGGTQLAPVADTYVRGGTSASTNFGTATGLEVKDGTDPAYDRHALLRFNMTNISGATSAVLRLFVDQLPNGAPSPVCLFAVASDTWSETGTTWNNQPAAGANLGCQNIAATGWVSFDVTANVRQELAGDKQVSFLLVDQTLANRMARFSSRESPTNKPVLDIR